MPGRSRSSSGYSEEQLTRVHSPIMSPLAWDLGHIAAYEDLWLAHRLGGQDLLRPDLAGVYDAFETPRKVRADVGGSHPPTRARTWRTCASARASCSCARASATA